MAEKKENQSDCKQWIDLKFFSFAEKILFGIIVLFIIFIIFLCVKSYDKDDISNSFDNIVAAATCIMASLSVIFTIVSIRQTNKNRLKDHTLEISSRWYKDLIIDRHIPNIIAFFDECENLISPLLKIYAEQKVITGGEYDTKIKSEVAGPFTERYTNLHRKLISDLIIIDSKLSAQVSSAFQRLQDGFVDFYIKPETKSIELQDFLKGAYREIISILMKYEQDSINK